jgi:hypothetical protein
MLMVKSTVYQNVHNIERMIARSECPDCNGLLEECWCGCGLLECNNVYCPSVVSTDVESSFVLDNNVWPVLSGL